jgi:Ribonuclease G/E
MLSYQPCPYCSGKGKVRSPITIAIYAFKELKRFLKDKSLKQVNLTLAPLVIEEILKDKESLRAIEHRFRTKINLISHPASHIEEIRIS